MERKTVFLGPVIKYLLLEEMAGSRAYHMFYCHCSLLHQILQFQSHKKSMMNILRYLKISVTVNLAINF